MKFTAYRNVRDLSGVQHELPWHEFVAFLKKEACTLYPLMTKAESSQTLKAWSPTTFSGTRRSNNAEIVHTLVLDFDKVVIPPEEAMKLFPQKACILHTTRSDSPEARSFRMILPYDKPLSSERHYLTWLGVYRYLESHGIAVDKACKDASRLYFLPATIGERKCEVFGQEGEALNTEKLMKMGELELTTLEGSRVQEENALPIRSQPSNNQQAETSAIKYLIQAKPAIAGQCGAQTAFSVARSFCKAFGQKLPVELAWDLFAEVYNPRCIPPWRGRQLTDHLKNAIFKEAWNKAK